MPLNWSLPLLLLVMAMTVTDGTSAAPLSASEQCQIYGFVPRTPEHALCRMNVRRYRTTGPCSNGSFAAMRREYCYLNLPPFL